MIVFYCLSNQGFSRGKNGDFQSWKIQSRYKLQCQRKCSHFADYFFPTLYYGSRLPSLRSMCISLLPKAKCM